VLNEPVMENILHAHRSPFYIAIPMYFFIAFNLLLMDVING
jgi:hypothetical protein